MQPKRRVIQYASADLLEKPTVPYWFGARIFGMSRNQFDAAFEKRLRYQIRHTKHRTLGFRLHLVDLLEECYPKADNYTIHRLAMEIAAARISATYDLSREHLSGIRQSKDGGSKSKQKGDIENEAIQEKSRKAG